ncbi:MAG: discoidin domain-containing protein, partial [Leptospiraceae bacterium]|nr:discoidin domain-containing protein [Leptospiraceae bacterium]
MLEQKPTIRISHPEWHRLASLDCSGKVELHKGELISYEEIQKEPGNTSIIFHFENEVYFNTISFQAKPGEVIYMPDVFRFEISQDGNCWESIIQEHSYSSRNSNEFISNFALIRAKKVKLLIKIKQLMRDDSYKVSFSNLHIGISGIIKIDASSENDRYWVKENLIDSRPDYGWSSKEKENPEEESLQFDLGSVNRVEELRLLTRDHADVHFPNKLFFYYSEDDLSWFQLFEELNFLSERNTWYKWRFLPTNMRFLKIVCVNETP